MRRLSTTRLRVADFSLPSNFSHISTYAVFVLLFCLLTGSWGYAQNDSFSGPPALDPLGAHGSGGRDCVICHPPHNELPSLRIASAPWIDGKVLWAGAAVPAYGQTLAIGEWGNVVEVAPGGYATVGAETTGVLLCLSCHDGNVTAQNMMAGRSYLQMMGLLPSFRGQAVPSLLEEQQRSNRVDHPLGLTAMIETGNGLEFSNGVFSVKPNTPYARFVAAYGLPTLAPSMRSNPYGIDAEGRPYLVCTTCHNQHVMSVYVSNPGSPIASDHAYRSYKTFFFVNAPYSHGVSATNDKASSASQFCRQCHFRFANEGNNTYFIPTRFE